MGLLPLLRAAMAVSALLALAALIYLVIRTRGLGTRPLYSEPAGSSSRGVWYAFTTGMLPWHKESAGKHLPTFITGIFYHLSILTGLALLAATACSAPFTGSTTIVMQVVLVVGLLSGLGLLVKRVAVSYMRRISVPDDFVSNLLVDLFIAGALVSSFTPTALVWWYGVTVALFLYIPLGKIRHCFFFFYARILFGAFFGRRGVFTRESRAGIPHE